MDDAYQRHERAEISHTEYFDSLRQTLELELTDEQFAEGWNSIYVGEVEGMANVLKAAGSRFPLYAFTNSNALHKSAWAQRFRPLLEPFARVFCSSDMGMRKPEARAFAYIAKEIGIPSDRILFFDDHPENVQGAINAGLQAALFETVESAERILFAS